MLQRFFLAGATALVLALLPAIALAQSPYVTFQGYLTDDLGVPIDGAVTLTLKLYDAELDTPEPATVLHEETQTVSAFQGDVTVYLGMVLETPLDLGIFAANNDIFLGIAVGTNAEMTPRMRLASSPFAAHAGNATTLQGLTPAQIGSAATPMSTSVAYDNSTTMLPATNAQDAIDTLLGRIDVLEGTVASLQTTMATVQSDVQSNVVAIGAVENSVTGLDGRLTILEAQGLVGRMVAVETKTGPITYYADLNGHAALAIDDVNVYVRNGLGDTSSTNGRGNLIVGYNAVRGDGTDDRAGSHNLIVGEQNNYGVAAYASIIGGSNNEVDAAYAATIGGFNTAIDGAFSAVIGGSSQVVSAMAAVAVGGQHHLVSGHHAATIGGAFNQADLDGQTLVGGGGAVGSTVSPSAGTVVVRRPENAVLWRRLKEGDVPGDRGWPVKVLASYCAAQA